MTVPLFIGCRGSNEHLARHPDKERLDRIAARETEREERRRREGLRHLARRWGAILSRGPDVDELSDMQEGEEKKLRELRPQQDEVKGSIEELQAQVERLTAERDSLFAEKQVLEEDLGERGRADTGPSLGL